MAKSRKRLVRVFIVDPNQSVPIERSVLYDGKEFWTDLDDQDLILQIDLPNLLKTHNVYRTTLPDLYAQRTAGATCNLEAATVMDIKTGIMTLCSA